MSHCASWRLLDTVMEKKREEGINKSDATSQMSHINFTAFIHADEAQSF